VQVETPVLDKLERRAAQLAQPQPKVETFEERRDRIVAGLPDPNWRPEDDERKFSGTFGGTPVSDDEYAELAPLIPWQGFSKKVTGGWDLTVAERRVMAEEEDDSAFGRLPKGLP